MSSLPSGWIEPAISDVAEVNPRKDVDLSTLDLVSFVPMAAVDEVSGTILSPVDRPYGEVSKGFTHFRDEDVIFAKITPSMENGKSAVARGLTNGTGMGSTEFHVFRSNGAIEPEYLWRFVRQKSFRENAQAVMSGAVGQQRVPADYLKDHLIPLAPLPEQRRIVAKVDGLTARTARARQELDRIPTLIARYKQRLLALAFSGELTAGWRAAKGLSDAKEVALVDVAKGFSYGTSAKSAPSGDVPVLRMGNIQDGKLDWTNLVFTSDKAEIKKYTLVPGDVLFNRTNSPELVGKTALYKGEQDAVYAGYLIRIQCTEKLMPEYLTYSLNGPAGRDYCWAVKTDGVSQSNINAKKIAAFRFLLPSLEEQAEIVHRIESAFGWLDRMAADHAAAARLLPKLDAAILAKAFQGNLVPQDPNDEPAAKLLERIKAEREAAPKEKSGRGRKAKLPPITATASGELVITGSATATVIPRKTGKVAMTKSRQDDDVKDKPYLAGLLKSGRFNDAQSLFRAAGLPVADFYKQLAWEIDKGHILDSAEELKAA
ncbi:MAG: restriction endonuclease subunit S [Erythrobacter sp.]|nr:restriction endonuclease subunit S [Erythrobacter sp.]